YQCGCPSLHRTRIRRVDPRWNLVRHWLVLQSPRRARRLQLLQLETWQQYCRVMACSGEDEYHASRVVKSVASQNFAIGMHVQVVAPDEAFAVIALFCWMPTGSNHLSTPQYLVVFRYQ